MACHSEASEAQILPVSPTPLVFNAPPPSEGFPWADLREILHGSPQMPSVQHRVKILPKSLTV